MTTVPQAGDFITATYYQPSGTHPTPQRYPYVMSGRVYELEQFPGFLWLGSEVLASPDGIPPCVSVTVYPRPEVSA